MILIIVKQRTSDVHAWALTNKTKAAEAEETGEMIEFYVACYVVFFIVCVCPLFFVQLCVMCNFVCCAFL
jgi:hypothetical protein